MPYPKLTREKRMGTVPIRHSRVSLGYGMTRGVGLGGGWSNSAVTAKQQAEMDKIRRK